MTSLVVDGLLCWYPLFVYFCPLVCYSPDPTLFFFRFLTRNIVFVWPRSTLDYGKCFGFICTGYLLHPTVINLMQTVIYFMRPVISFIQIFYLHFSFSSSNPCFIYLLFSSGKVPGLGGSVRCVVPEHWPQVFVRQVTEVCVLQMKGVPVIPVTCI